jgi:hypothetical protein
VLYVLDDINDNELKGLDFFENVFRMAHADKNHSTTTKQAGMLDEVRIVPLFVAAPAAGQECSASKGSFQRPTRCAKECNADAATGAVVSAEVQV